MMILVFIIGVCLREQIIENLELREQEFLINTFIGKVSSPLFAPLREKNNPQINTDKFIDRVSKEYRDELPFLPKTTI